MLVAADINFEAKRQRGFKLPILGQELKEKKKHKIMKTNYLL
jgi:SRSO17 transposase